MASAVLIGNLITIGLFIFKKIGASAGLERGQLQGIIKLAFNPNNAQRDILYKNGLNPIVSFAGQGIVMWGFENGHHTKTLLNCWDNLRAA